MGWAILGFITACIIFPPVLEFAEDNWVLLIVGLFIVGWILQIVDRFRFPTSSFGGSSHWKSISPGSVVKCTCTNPNCR
jgi:hypothetical protein